MILLLTRIEDEYADESAINIALFRNMESIQEYLEGNHGKNYSIEKSRFGQGATIYNENGERFTKRNTDFHYNVEVIEFYGEN